jgi:hypothetical protein
VLADILDGVATTHVAVGDYDKALASCCDRRPLRKLRISADWRAA